MRKFTFITLIFVAFSQEVQVENIELPPPHEEETIPQPQFPLIQNEEGTIPQPQFPLVQNEEGTLPQPPIPEIPNEEETVPQRPLKLPEPPLTFADMTMPRIPKKYLYRGYTKPEKKRYAAKNILQFLSRGLCLELGPLHVPVLPREHENTRYADVLDEESLRIKYQNHQNVPQEKIPHIHYVITPGKRLAEVTLGHKFFLIMAQNIIEHVPDPISWFQEIYEVMAPGAILRLILPDRRFSYDFRRRPTNIPDLIGAYLEKRTRSPPSAVYEYRVRKKPSIGDSKLLWIEPPSPEHEIDLGVHDGALIEANRSLFMQVDTHIWAFMPATLIHHLYFLNKAGLVPLKVREGSVVVTKPLTNVFMLELTRIPLNVLESQNNHPMAYTPPRGKLPSFSPGKIKKKKISTSSTSSSSSSTTTTTTTTTATSEGETAPLQRDVLASSFMI